MLEAVDPVIGDRDLAAKAAQDVIEAGMIACRTRHPCTGPERHEWRFGWSVARERIAAKAAVIADLRHRLDVADRRLDEAADERRLTNRLRDALADAVAAERITASEAAGLRAELEARHQWRLFRRFVWALRRR